MRLGHTSECLVAVLALSACSNPETSSSPSEPPLNGPFTPLEASPILVDGRFDDWEPTAHFASDPEGDAEGGFDLVGLGATSRGTELFLRIELASPVNLYNGPAHNGTLLVDVRLPSAQLSIDFRARRAFIDGVDTHWKAVALVAAPSHAATAFEVRVDLARAGAQPGIEVALDVRGSDTASLTVPIANAAAAPEPLSVTRAPGATLRVASLNTELGGLFQPGRADPMARLLRAAAADVYCLQELGQASESAIAERLRAVDDVDWHVHALSSGTIVGNAIASRAPLLPIPLAAERVAAAVVLAEPPVAVVSVHLKCCGYQGSAEDATRFAQVGALADGLTLFKSAAINAELAPYRDVPIVVAGDFNDVGSAGLTSALRATRAPIWLERWPLRHVAGSDLFTWSSYETSFPPATLDMFLYQDLEPLGGVVFDSRALPTETLDALGLRGDESNTSDHFMLVADLR